MQTVENWIESIESGGLDAPFRALYGAQSDVLAGQRLRYIEALRSFDEYYGGRRAVSLYSTPGRTEIGGNHTDHNRGAVLAAAVNLDIIAVVAQNSDGVIRVRSKGFKGEDAVSLGQLEPIPGEFNRSSALIRGVAAGIRKNSGDVGGFDAYTASDVLKGSGLSSSAAFEVCLGAILNSEYNGGKFTPVQLGIIGQYAENVFFGKPSGLMDQLACAVGSVISIDFKNPQNPAVEKIPFDLAATGYSLVITDTKCSHADLAGEYTAIRDEMVSVAACFGKQALRDVPEEAFLRGVRELRAKVGDRAVLRAIHFYEDSRRAANLAEALRRGDFNTFLQLILAGGHSAFEYNQNAYSILQPHSQGVPLALALSQLVLQGQGAWRLQGGGFAGAIQAFVPQGLLPEYCKTLNGVFGGDACHVLTVREAGCIKLP